MPGGGDAVRDHRRLQPSGSAEEVTADHRPHPPDPRPMGQHQLPHPWRPSKCSNNSANPGSWKLISGAAHGELTMPHFLPSRTLPSSAARPSRPKPWYCPGAWHMSNKGDALQGISFFTYNRNTQTRTISGVISASVWAPHICMVSGQLPGQLIDVALHALCAAAVNTRSRGRQRSKRRLRPVPVP